MQNQLQTEETPVPQGTTPILQETESAIEAIENLQTAQAVSQRFTAFQQKRKRHKARLVKYLFGIAGAVFFPIVLMPLLMTLFGGGSAMLPLSILLSFTLPLLVYILFSISRRPLSEADELAGTGGVKAIGDLLMMQSEAVSLRDKRAITDALTRLLPQLKFSDANLLNRQHRALLHQYLTSMTLPIKRTPQTIAFATAILQALEQVGDASALPVVRQIADMKARTPEQERFKAAAKQCLPALEANLGQVDATQTLLRASMPQTAAPDTLLRPAAFTTADPKQLLRAALSEDDAPHQ